MEVILWFYFKYFHCGALIKLVVVHEKVHCIGYKKNICKKGCRIWLWRLIQVNKILWNYNYQTAYLLHHPWKWVQLTEFGKSLAINHYNKDIWTQNHFIWVMKGYDFVESWSKKYNILINTDAGIVMRFRNDGEILLTRSKWLLCKTRILLLEEFSIKINTPPKKYLYKKRLNDLETHVLSTWNNILGQSS